MSNLANNRSSGAAAHATAASNGPRRVTVEIADAARLADMHAHWTDLLGRAAAPNVFMDPALVGVAASIDPDARHRALLAWETAGGRNRLVSIWSFAVGRPRRSMLPMQTIVIPAYAHGHLATPVIDRDCLDETLDAMLDGIASDRQLPKIITIDAMGAGEPTYDALIRVLESRGSAPCVFDRGQRPKLASALDGKAYLENALSSSTRKKLRQHRRKLSENGTLTSTVATEPEAVRQALEEFLTMEASGWKGHEGTALANNEGDAAFMRGAMA